jgi:hypothetical protein
MQGIKIKTASSETKARGRERILMGVGVSAPKFVQYVQLLRDLQREKMTQNEA